MKEPRYHHKSAMTTPISGTDETRKRPGDVLLRAEEEERGPADCHQSKCQQWCGGSSPLPGIMSCGELSGAPSCSQGFKKRGCVHGLAEIVSLQEIAPTFPEHPHLRFRLDPFRHNRLVQLVTE